MVVTVLLMQVSAEWLVRMVSGSSEALVLENGARYLRWTSPFYAVLGVLLSTRYALQSLGEKVLPLFSSVIEFLGKVVFVLVFIPRFAYDAVILCEPVVWCFMTLYLVAVYRCNPFVFPKNMTGAPGNKKRLQRLLQTLLYWGVSLQGRIAKAVDQGVDMLAGLAHGQSRLSKLA